MRILTKVIFLIFTLNLFISCEKFLEIPPPKTQAQSKEIFSTDETAISAVSGIYTQLSVDGYWLMDGGPTFVGALSADELYNTSPDTEVDAFATNSLLPSDNYRINSLWQPGFRSIYQVNAVLDGLQTSTITDSIKKQIRGEALVIRAINYFYLVNFFGDVPLIVNTDYAANSSMPRTKVEKVYQQIIADLLKAKELLVPAYPRNIRGRINKWTAVSFLARVYLYIKDWENAEKEATEVISSGMYALEPDPVNAFRISSSEAIWESMKQYGNTSLGQQFIPYAAYVLPNFALTNSLLSSFEDNDLRKTSWLNINIVEGREYYYPFKYKDGGYGEITEYLIVLRLPELYLIRSEARAHLEKLSEGVDDLNVIRARAGLDDTEVSDITSLLSSIEHERRIEFFAEWGHRWLDLKRTDRANAVLGAEKATNWQTYDMLYPLPFYDMQTNPFLVQNEGY